MVPALDRQKRVNPQLFSFSKLVPKSPMLSSELIRQRESTAAELAHSPMYGGRMFVKVSVDFF